MAELAVGMSPANKQLALPVIQPRAAIGKTVLVFDRAIPQFDRDAGSRSSFQYLSLFLEMGLKVMFYPADQVRREPYASLLERMGVELVFSFGCCGWKSWLRAQADRFDVLFFHRPNVTYRFIRFARRITNAQILYCGHDLRYLRDRRRYEVEGDAFFLAESRYWEKIEREIADLADKVYYFSVDECSEIAGQVPGVVAETLPLFIITPYSDGEAEDSFKTRDGLLFVGNFIHEPNADGILWFMKEIFPLIKDAISSVQLVVVGANPPSDLLDLASDHVTVTGNISEADLQSYYRHSRVVVAPLRYGAGVKGKIIEAMGYGVPVVTTSVGAEGIPGAGLAFVIEDAPVVFAAKVVSVFKDQLVWENLRYGAEQVLAEHYSAKSAMAVLSKAMGFAATTASTKVI